MASRKEVFLMPHGFPGGKFRIFHVETQRYLVKRGGNVHSADTSATYDAPGGTSKPTPGLRSGLRSSADEVWSYDDGGRLVNAVEEAAGRGHYVLRVLDSGGVSMIGAGSLYGARWEFTDGFIKVRDRHQYLVGSADDHDPCTADSYAIYAARYQERERDIRMRLRLSPSDEIPEEYKWLMGPAPDKEKVEASQKWELKKA
ncbi:hypothetical protein [Streptomyces xanthophaeus]|uniref:hypothetical protein n=1 Tax=Streptomyces xanthophaeus TaxID=67385 RepID=UPI003716EFF4